MPDEAPFEGTPFVSAVALDWTHEDEMDEDGVTACNDHGIRYLFGDGPDEYVSYDGPVVWRW